MGSNINLRKIKVEVEKERQETCKKQKRLDKILIMSSSTNFTPHIYDDNWSVIKNKECEWTRVYAIASYS